MKKLLLFIISVVILMTYLTSCNNSSIVNNPDANNRKYDLEKIDLGVKDVNQKKPLAIMLIFQVLERMSLLVM